MGRRVVEVVWVERAPWRRMPPLVRSAFSPGMRNSISQLPLITLVTASIGNLAII